MAEVQAKDFTFNNISLSDIIPNADLVTFDTMPSDTDVDVFNGKVNKSDIHYNSPITNFYSLVPKENLEFSIVISKRDGDYLTQDEVSALVGWLTAPHEPVECYFTPYDDNDYWNTHIVHSGVFYIGVFHSWGYSEMGQVGKMGIRFDFENISPYGFTEEVGVTIKSSGSSGKTATFLNIGDAIGLKILPKITITPKATGTVTISNTADSREPLSINVTQGKVITIEDYNAFDSDGKPYSISKYFNNLNWVYLYDINNAITVIGSADVTITARFFKNVGV